MNTPKNAQFIVITPFSYNSGWDNKACHTEAEAFAVASDLHERGQEGLRIVDIENGTCLPFVPFR
jgi:hypothetical protein